MSSPFAHVRRAVARWAGTARTGPAAPGAAGAPPAPGVPGEMFQGSLAAVGVYDSRQALLIATYPAAPYNRLIEIVTTTCSQVVPVTLYAGRVAPEARLSTYGDGSRAEYSPSAPRFLPQGTPLLVAWSVTSSTATGAANAQIRGA